MTKRNEGYVTCADGITSGTNDDLRYLNDKGLVERDHVTKKDTFYLYKAEWNPTPFVHICGKDYTNRNDREIKCYTNDGNELLMYVNDDPTPRTAQVTDHIAVFAADDYAAGTVIRVEGATTQDTFTF